MMKKMKIIMLLMFLSLFFTGCNDSHKYDDRIKEITDTDFSGTMLFESEHGFGNDEFNIYAFSLDNSQDTSQFTGSLKPIDDKFFELWENNFLSMLNGETESDNYSDFDKETFLEEFSELENNENTRYQYIGNEVSTMSSELVVYNEEMNKGYYFVIIF